MKLAIPEKNKLANNNIIYFIIASVFLMLVGTISKGLFTSPFQIFFVFLAFLILLLPFLNIRSLDRIYLIASVKNLLLISTAISMIIFYFFDGGIYLISQEAIQKINALKFVALAIFLFYFVKTNGKISFFHNFINHIIKYKFAYLIALAIIMRIATISFSPNPAIDVFYVTNEAVDNLIAGVNPYSASYTSPWSGWYSNPGYLPAVIFMNIPGRIIFGDVRFGYIIAQLIIIVIIYLLLRKKYAEDKTMIELPILMFMFLPNSLFVLEQTWIEPLLLLILFLFALIFTKQKISYLACAALGIFLSLKQNNFPFLLLALSNFNIHFKKMLTILSAAFLLTIPFLIWNFRDFIKATIFYIIDFKIQTHSVSLNSLYAIIFNKEIPYYIIFGMILALMVFLIFHAKKNGLIGYIHSSTIVMLFLFFLLWGYANYYYFISGSLILLITLNLLLTDKNQRINNVCIIK